MTSASAGLQPPLCSACQPNAANSAYIPPPSRHAALFLPQSRLSISVFLLQETCRLCSTLRQGSCPCALFSFFSLNQGHMIKHPSFSAKRSQYGAGKRKSPRLPYCCSVSHSAQKGNVSAMACVRSSFCDRISHQFSFFIIFLPHSDVIMTLVKVESHPPLRAAFASFLPLHHTRRQASSFFLPLPHLFPFHNEKRRFPSHHGTDAFRMYALTTHYVDINEERGAGNGIPCRI